MNNLQDGGLVLDDLKYVDLTPQELATWRLEPGDVVFNRTNSKELVGKCEVFDEPGDWAFASYLMRLRVDRARALPEFVSAFLSTKAGRSQINRESRQIIGMSNINAEELRTLRIPLPETSRQADLLEALNAARKARLRTLEDASALIRSLNEVVVRKVELRLPPSYEVISHAVRLHEVSRNRIDAAYHSPRHREGIRELHENPLPKMTLGYLSPQLAGGATPTRGDDDLYASEGIRFLRIMNVAPFEIILRDVKYITPEVHEGALSRSQLQVNDVLITITGRVGTAAVVPRELLPANINQHIVRLRLQTDEVLPEYLAAYLNSSFGLLLTKRGVSGGTRIAIDYETIRKLEIPIPSISVQEEIMAEVHSRRTEARRLRREAESIWERAKVEFEFALLGSTEVSSMEGEC